MKRTISLFLILSLLLMSGCGDRVLQKESITIYHATDMHYLSQQLTENSPAFVEMISNGDGKMVHYIDQIMDAFVADVVENKPDYLMVSGDMTFNGEKLSHIDLAEKFAIIEKCGTQILVIPGNHDVDYPFCYGYGETKYYPADRMTDEEFEQLYQPFGLKQAYTRDNNSFSYMYRLTDKITLIALDTNRGGGTGVISMDTLSWLEKELEKAVSEDTTFICMTHQNLLQHFGNESFTNSYSIINNQPLIDLFNKYGVKINFSGHIHTQHIFSDGNITDVTTESLAVLPCNYGVVTIENNKLDYKTKAVDVAGWAKDNNIEDNNLLQFADYSEKFYITSQKNLCLDSIVDTTTNKEDAEIMADFFANLNVFYFSGTVHEQYSYLAETDGYKKWLEKGKDLWHYQYIMARMEEGRTGIVHNEYCAIFD